MSDEVEYVVKYQHRPEKLYRWCPICTDWFDVNSLHVHYKDARDVQNIIDYRDKLDRIIELLESIEYQLRTN